MAANAGETKVKLWEGICYPENMRDDWQDEIDDILQVPFAYAVHDIDHDQKSKQRKTHAHVIVVWGGNTTRKAIINVLNRLSADGKKCCSSAEPINNIRHAYDYLIHDTASCRKKGKELYPVEARIEGNNFDIGQLEQLSTKDKQDMLFELVGFIMCERFETINDFTAAALREFPEQYREIIVGYNSILERYCRGNYLNAERKRKCVEQSGAIERQRVETRAKLGAVTEQVDEKRAQAAEIDRRIAEKMAELDRLDGEIGEKLELRNEVGDEIQRESARLESLRRGTRAVARDVEELRPVAAEIGRWDGEIGEKLELRNEVGDEIQRESARLESLRRGTRAVARDVEELRPVAAEIGRWEAAGRAERGTILDSIAARCAGAARAARAAIEELGDRIWALMRPRKAQGGERSLDDVMREATEAARVGSVGP